MDIPIIKPNHGHKHLLDCDGAMEMAANFQDAIDLLNELVSYGTNLVVRAFTSSDRDLKAICVLLVQLRQFLMHLDGIAILLAVGNCGTADLQLRSLLETAHVIEWILANDTEAKINYLYIANLRRRRQWQGIAIAGSLEAARHSGAASQLKVTAQERQEIADEVRRIDTVLGQSPFDAINAAFEPHYARRGFDQPWYEVYGAKSIRDVADQIGKLKEYDYIYSGLSGATHGSDIWKSIFLGKDKTEISPIREPQHIPRIVQLAATLALRIYPLILKEFRSGEEENFARKYVHECWGRRFLRKYEIELTPRDMII
jgi:hypothetical protein